MAIQRLTAAFCRNVQGQPKPRRYGDGFGLMLLVKPSGAKSWVQRLTVNGVRRDMGLGPYPFVSLAQARMLAYDNAKAAWQGRDPRAERRAAKPPTFAEAVAAVFAIRETGWSQRYAKEWRNQMTGCHVKPIAKMPVDAIQTGDVLGILSPVWTDQPKLGRDLRQRIGLVLQWAVGEKHRRDNPVQATAALLPRQRPTKRHHEALPYAKVPDAYAAIAAEPRSHPNSRLALQFLILTAARTSEVRGAKWSEIDMEAATWTVPAERMKAREAHAVPLSDAAIAILRQAGGAGDGLIFPGASGQVSAVRAYPRVLERCGITAKVHGFRSSFRDWAAERNVPRDVCEAALAHKVSRGTATELAYLRTDQFDQRRDLMATWGAYCTAEPGAKVTYLRA